MNVLSRVIRKVPKALLIGAASLFILAIFILSLVVYNESAAMHHSKVMRTKLKIQSIEMLIYEFEKYNGHFPVELSELQNSGFKGLPLDNSSQPFFYQYNEKDNSFRVYTLGNDGKVGGEGLDADFDNFTKWETNGL